MQEIKKAVLFAIIGLPFIALSSHIVSNPLPTVSLDSEDSRSLVTIAAHAEEDGKARFGY